MWKYVMACYGTIANQASYLHAGKLPKYHGNIMPCSKCSLGDFGVSGVQPGALGMGV